MTVVVHSFVADSSLLDCFDLVVCFLGVFFFHLVLAARQPFGVLRWFQLFLFLSFGVSCLLAWLGQPFSFATRICGLVFLCHRHLWSVLSFFATGICVRSLSFTAFSAVGVSVSTCFRVSVYLSIFGIMLCTCCSGVSFILGDSNWIFFQVGYPVDNPTNFTLKQTPLGIPP